MRKLLISTFTLLTILSAYAQTGKLFNTDKMLSSNFATEIYQDHNGFIWISTRNGLNRYDGYTFKVFKKNSPESVGMASNYINTVIETKENILLVGERIGLQAYYDDRFHDITLFDNVGNKVISYVTSIIQLKNGDIIIGTSGNGAFIMNGKNEARQFLPLINVMGVKRLYETKDGTLWVLTERQGALSLYKGKKTTWLTDSNIAAGLTDICQGEDGSIYISTYDQGVFVKNAGSKAFAEIPETKDMHVSALHTSSDGRILLGLDGEGIAFMDALTHNITMNPFFSHEMNINHAKVCDFIEDRMGNIWFCMLQKGVFMQPTTPSNFGYAGYKLRNKNIIGDCCVTSVFIDSKGNRWIGTDKDGLYLLNSNFQIVKHFTNVPSTILTINEDYTGRIWLGSYQRGLGYIDTNDKAFHKVEIGALKRLNVFGIVASDINTLWIATMGQGLIRYNIATGETKIFQASDEATRNNKINALINQYISQIALSADRRRLYLATTMGLVCLDIAAESWTKTLGVNALNYGTNIRSVIETNGKYLWYGTDDGLYRRDLTDGKTEVITKDNGLSDNGIAAMTLDSRGNLWVSTNHGLNKLDVKTADVEECFFVDDGLQSNEFSDGAAATGTDGTLLFGGVGGITWFKGNETKTKQWKAAVELTGLIVNGKAVASGDESGRYTITDMSVIKSNHFDLSPDDNSFALQFSTLTFGEQEHIAYAYSINGDTWRIQQPGQNELNFSHMPPGEYKFKVKAVKGKNESQVKEFTIHVHAPWYMSPVAFILYFAIAVLAIYLYIQQRKRKEEDRLRLQAHIHAEEMNEAKLKFFMNISHEIRTPMTLVVAPLVTLLKEDTDPKRKVAYTTIKRNAERILHLINQMMDLRKIDKGMMKMHMRETDIIGFIYDICNMFDYQAKAKSIELTFHHDMESLKVWIDLTNFDKVLVNLLSNAFKYTPSGGKIDIYVEEDDGYMRLTVKDSGEGISKDEIQNIFIRFYQKVSATNDRHFGTGIGLDLTNSLVQLHHGSITAKNNDDGPGASFIVLLPLGNSHLTPEEMVIATDEHSQLTELLKDSFGDDRIEKNVEPITTQKSETPENAETSETKEIDEEAETTDETEATSSEDIKEKDNDTETATAKRTHPLLVIVEDDIDIQLYLKTQLDSMYQIKTYNNGQEAMANIIKDVPDIIISDIMMPVMDGITLCTKVKNNILTNDIPVILLTAKTQDEDKLQGLETGADAYIVKPFNLDILKRTVFNLINTRHVMRNKMAGSESQDDKVKHIEMVTPDDKLMEKIMKVINANLSNSDLNVDYIAREVGLSRVHFYRKMKMITNQSPHNFIRNIRMKQAARLFDSGHQSVNDVMYAVGFSNTSSFSTAFKAVYGVAPREYIKESRARKGINS